MTIKEIPTFQAGWLLAGDPARWAGLWNFSTFGAGKNDYSENLAKISLVSGSRFRRDPELLQNEQPRPRPRPTLLRSLVVK